MRISDVAVRRPVITIVGMVALSLFGLIALNRLKTDEYPDVEPPFVSVGIVYPGAAPDGVEREVLAPVEEVVAAVSGVKKITGYARDGYAQLVIEFQFGKSLLEATQDIRDGLSAIRGDLPAEIEEPVIRKLSDTDRPIVSLALASEALTAADLTRLVDPGLTRELRSLAGVAEVNIIGRQDRELTVLLRPEALRASGVAVWQVVEALRRQNLAVPVGRLETDLEERSIRLAGRLTEPQDFLRLVVAERRGRLIRLGELAEVRDGSAEPRSLTLFDGREAVGIEIKKAKGYSTTEVSARIRERVARLQGELPPGVALTVVKDSGERVKLSVRNVEEALVEGALLTVLVVFLFLNSWRSTVITGLALPVSVLASFIAVWAFGFTLNTMSLMGLSLAIGILIDDAIVVRENIVRHVEMGKDHLTAAREGTGEIGLAVTATTISILAVFIPIAFLPGIAGQWFKPFGLTIACSVAVSLLVSFSLDPMLSAYWPDPHRTEAEKGWLTRALDRFNAYFNRMAARYRVLIAWALDHRLAVLAIAAGSFVLALAMPAMGLVGTNFMPLDDRGEFNVHFEAPPGSSLDYSRRMATEVVGLIHRYPETRHTYVTLGGGGAGQVDEGNLYVRLSPRHERAAGVEDVAARLRRETEQIGGVKLSVYTADMGGMRKQVQIEVRGHDIPLITAVAEQVQRLIADVPGVVDLGLSTRGRKPELTITVNRALAGSLGLTVGDIAQSVRPAFAGVEAGTWVDPSGETRDVAVRFPSARRARPEDLRSLPLLVPGAGGLPVPLPLGQVADVTRTDGPAVITHLNRDPVVIVGANLSGRPGGEVMTDIRSRLAGLPVPPGVRVTEGGEAEQQDEVFGNIFLALGVAALLMYLILVMQFGSFLDPLAIMLSLPLSMIGVMLALFVTGLTINIMSLIGVILLMGIVAKNAILLIDFARWARERTGMPLREALIEAGAIRLRPILMTTFALIAGMVPVALGRGEGAMFRQPLGASVIGGVITSTLLTLVAIPTFYEILDGFRGWLQALARRIFGREAYDTVVAAVTGEQRIGP